MLRDNIFEVAENARLAKYGDEDLLTDLFGFLLDLDRDLAGALFSTLVGVQTRVLAVETQRGFPDTETSDSPDMRVVAEDLVLITEHKIDSGLGDRQLERYLTSAEAHEEQVGRPVRVALITRDRVTIPTPVLEDPRYLRPADAGHFTWRDVFRVIEQSLSSCGNHVVVRLREQFLQHLEARGLAPISAPPGFPDLFAPETTEDRNLQQLAFGAAWGPAEQWLLDHGFERTVRGSRFECYAYPGEGVAPSPTEVFLWLYMKPTPSGKAAVPRDAGFRGPYLEIRVCCTAAGQAFLNRVLEIEPFAIALLDAQQIPCVISDTPQPGDRIAVSFWLPLSTLTADPEVLPERLLDVVRHVMGKLGIS